MPVCTAGNFALQGHFNSAKLIQLMSDILKEDDVAGGTVMTFVKLKGKNRDIFRD